MKNENKKKSWLFKNITLLSSFFIIIIIIISMAIVYYWSFYHFSKIFEDRVIDQYTLEDNEEIGMTNEWILGVTTDSIDVLEAIHGEEVSDHIHENALSQDSIKRLYKEKVGDKHLIYMIELDTKDGEHIYKYSVVKDIYKEIFPSIALSFLIFAMILFIISYIYSKSISNHLYNNIGRLVDYTKELSYNSSTKSVSIQTSDSMITDLAEAFNDMRKSLNDKEYLQQTTLEYISHEMKTPIMIIESYASSAKDNIFPKGDLNDSLDTIISQATRMKDKVNTLMTVAKVNSLPLNSTDYKKTSLSILIDNVIINLSELFKNKELRLYIDYDINIYVNPDKIQILLENLIENQIKYSNKLICIRSFIKDDIVTLLFYNDGDIIEENIKSDIFKPFVKGYKGSNGLGLSICKTITIQHSGDIEMIPTKTGTLFKVNLKDQSSPMLL